MPFLKLFDDKSNIRAVLGRIDLRNRTTASTEIRAESSLVLFNEKGNIFWEAP